MPDDLAARYKTALDKFKPTLRREISSKFAEFDTRQVPYRGPRASFNGTHFLLPLNMSDAVLTDLASSRIGPYEVSRVQGVLDVPSTAAGAGSSTPAGTGPWTTSTGTGGRGDGGGEGTIIQNDAPTSVVPLRAGLSGVLEPFGAGAAPEEAGSVRFISQGEVKLNELKQLLTRRGEHAEFVDGALVVNATVRVRKDGSQKLFLEGAYGEDYLRVRELLYSQVEAI